MKVYLAGPMSGIADFNFPAFHARAAALRADGFDVVCPAEGIHNEDLTKPWDFYMRADIKLLMDCEAIAVLPGWTQSKGASLEVHIARTLGMDVLDAQTMKPVKVRAW